MMGLIMLTILFVFLVITAITTLLIQMIKEFKYGFKKEGYMTIGCLLLIVWFALSVLLFALNI